MLQKKQKTVKERNDIESSIRDYQQVALALGVFGFFLVSKTMYNEIKSGYRYQPIMKS